MSIENLETVLVCDCSSAEHQIIVRHDKGDDDMYLTIHLIRTSFWYRVKYAFRYIFGYKCRYGAWDEFAFKKEHAGKLRDMAERLDPVWKRTGEMKQKEL